MYLVLHYLTQAFFNTFMVGCSGATVSLSLFPKPLKNTLGQRILSCTKAMFVQIAPNIAFISARFVRANISSFWHIYSKNVKNESSSGNSNPFDYYRYFLDFLGH